MDITAQVDAYFAKKPDAFMIFETLRHAVWAAYPSAQLRVMKTCICFDDPKPFAYVSFPPKKSLRGLWLSISLREAMAHPRFAMVVPVSKSRYTVHIHLPDQSAVDHELLSLIALSHR
ncbi:MAG: hypothetical protein IKK34_07265 [Clostridia bacterium]|nr:hypothetical protein [Clostridia bacterium]